MQISNNAYRKVALPAPDASAKPFLFEKKMNMKFFHFFTGFQNSFLIIFVL